MGRHEPIFNSHSVTRWLNKSTCGPPDKSKMLTRYKDATLDTWANFRYWKWYNGFSSCLVHRDTSQGKGPNERQPRGRRWITAAPFNNRTSTTSLCGQHTNVYSLLVPFTGESIKKPYLEIYCKQRGGAICWSYSWETGVSEERIRSTCEVMPHQKLEYAALDSSMGATMVLFSFISFHSTSWLVSRLSQSATCGQKRRARYWQQSHRRTYKMSPAATEWLILPRQHGAAAEQQAEAAPQKTADRTRIYTGLYLILTCFS